MVDGAPVSGTANLNSTVQWLEVTHGLNMVTLAAIGRASFRRSDRHPRGRAQVYGGLGLGPAITHAESTVALSNHETPYSVQGFPAFEAFLGARWFLTRHWLGLLEYKATHARVEAEVAGGRVAARFNTHHLTFGIGFSL